MGGNVSLTFWHSFLGSACLIEMMECEMCRLVKRLILCLCVESCNGWFGERVGFYAFFFKDDYRGREGELGELVCKVGLCLLSLYM